MKTFKVGDRVDHHTKGMATVICVNNDVDILLSLDSGGGNPYGIYRLKYKIDSQFEGSSCWEPSVDLCTFISRKATFKGNIK